jgi:hypothetical protein
MARKKEEKEITGGELTDYPNEQYKKFFSKFSEIDTLNVEDWKVVHILAYFCKKYKDVYNVDYKFKFNSPNPTKCFEVFQIKKLASMLTANPKLLKEYVDWVFLNKVVKAKRRLTSISFMTVEGIINEYKLNVLLCGKKNLNIDRSTPLPEKYKIIFKGANLNISTYGELAFISQMSDMSFEVIGAFQQIEELGFDKEVLTRIV